MLMSCGSDTNVVCGEIPSWSAAASTNGLNDEPGCRSPWTARLNWLSRKLRPPYMASTRPSRGSIATSAADGMPFSPSTSSTVRRARSWRSRSIVVVTLSPPPNTSAGPYVSMSCCFTYSTK